MTGVPAGNDGEQRRAGGGGSEPATVATPAHVARSR